MSGRVRTHWDGCWRVHLECAVAEVERVRRACAAQDEEVCQTLGKVLGCPWYKDHQDNFPGSTEAHGVCVGEHVAESIAMEAAREIERLRAAADWQPIETAPKDGTPMLWFGRWLPYDILPGGGPAIIIVRWSSIHSDRDPEKYMWITEGLRDPLTGHNVQWTHWRPLPGPPA